MRSVPSVVSFALAAGTLFSPLVAHAQNESRASPDHVVVGVGAIYAPAYTGADNYRALPIPVIDVLKGPFFLNLQDGVGLNVIDSGVLTIGGSVAFMPGYRRRDAPHGIGKLSSGAGARMFARLKAAGAVATVGATQGFAGGTRGVIVDMNLSYPIMASSRVTLVPAIGATWADRKYNNRYFGVDAAQALASGLPEFRAGAGFKDMSATLTANSRLTDRISVSLSGGVTRLLGRVQDSPIVFHKTRPLGILSLSYSLGS